MCYTSSMMERSEGIEDRVSGLPMFTFYKSNDTYAMLQLLLLKAREQSMSVSLCFENHEECCKFSDFLWNSGKVIPHGLAEQGFLNRQPVIIDTCLHEKDIAIIVDAPYENLGKWEKVFFVGTRKREFESTYITSVKYWEYSKQRWNLLTKEQFFA